MPGLTLHCSCSTRSPSSLGEQAGWVLDVALSRLTAWSPLVVLPQNPVSSSARGYATQPGLQSSLTQGWLVSLRPLAIIEEALLVALSRPRESPSTPLFTAPSLCFEAHHFDNRHLGIGIVRAYAHGAASARRYEPKQLKCEMWASASTEMGLARRRRSSRDQARARFELQWAGKLPAKLAR